MTPQEFKAWFDGFTEAMSAAPNEAQWEKIKKRVTEIDGRSVTYPIYVDRYLPSYPRPPYYGYYSSLSNCQTLNAQNLQCSGVSGQLQNQLQNSAPNSAFDSLAAMYSAGKLDAA